MKEVLVFTLILLDLRGICASNSGESYIFDDSVQLGRRFDGVGAISGGGATSKLLINYPEPQRSQVLDFLFKPNYGASLHILKVEIGGDVQSTEGTESSHQHHAWDEDYTRGYEWTIMKEAKKRNPSIKLYGLPWGFPGWLGRDGYWPFQQPNVTAQYVVNWVNGAKVHHGLDIDYIGLWNEKPYEVPYVLALRRELDSRGFHNVQIVAADMVHTDAWDIVKEFGNTKLNASVAILGGHYIATQTTPAAQACGKPLWSSEDYSAKDDMLGGGCIARIINQNYVYGLATSTIAWNLIASYYNDLPIREHGLMTANEPWSGHYKVAPPIWGAAHSTQFVSPGCQYLGHGAGVGSLKHGGSYVSLLSPDRKHFTVVMETLDTEKYDFCIRPPQVAYSVKDQNVTLVLQGSLAKIQKLNVWMSRVDSLPPVYFQQSKPIQVQNGTASVYLPANSIYTLSTVDTAHKGSVDSVPASKPFPLPYKENFDGYPINSEPFNFAQQVGAFEIRPAPNMSAGSLRRQKEKSFAGSLDNSVEKFMTGSQDNLVEKSFAGSLKAPRRKFTAGSQDTGVEKKCGGGRVYQQVMTQAPVHWCPVPLNQPVTFIGNYNWSSVSVSAAVHVPSVNGSRGVFVGARVSQGGCYTMLAKGVFLWLLHDEQQVVISTDLARGRKVFIAPYAVQRDVWYTLELQVKGNTASAAINGKKLFSRAITMTTRHGFVALGTDNFGLANFDDFKVQ